MRAMIGSSVAFRRCVLTAALAIALTALNIPAGGQTATGEPVKIGVLEDRSGVVTFISQEHVKALKMAADAINGGRLFHGAPPATSGKPGILGRPIQLMFEDTQADPNQALSKARRLASSGAQAIVVTTTSPDTLQARLVCEEAQIVCIGVSVAALAIVKPPNNAYVFTLAPSFDVQAEQLIAALKARDYSAIAIVRDDSGAVKTQADTFKAKFGQAGVRVVADEVVPAGARELAGQLLRVRQAQPRAVLNLVTPPAESALFMKAYQTSGIGAPLFAMGGLIASPETWKLAGPAVDGTVVVDYLSPEDPEAKVFAEQFRSVHGKDAPFLSIHPMDLTSLLLLKRAMEDAGRTSGPAVKGALEQVRNFPAGFGQRGYTVNYSPADHNGATSGSIVLVEFAGQKPSKLWPAYQPSLQK
jgi:branched-chain amino acid transport system substrate-binding protein